LDSRNKLKIIAFDKIKDPFFSSGILAAVYGDIPDDIAYSSDDSSKDGAHDFFESAGSENFGNFLGCAEGVFLAHILS
jgi:hypothetical protein